MLLCVFASYIKNLFSYLIFNFFSNFNFFSKKVFKLNLHKFVEGKTAGKETDKLIMIDFWATWCGPCLSLAPTVEAIAEDYKGKMVVGKVNVDENPAVSFKFKIRSLPTILFVKDGKVVDKQIGNVPRAALEAKIQKLL